MSLVEQSVLRAPDGTRWVVTTTADGAGFVTTARKTGCDLSPAATTRTSTPALAAAAHRAQVERVRREGRPATPAP